MNDFREVLNSLQAGIVGVIGAPFDENSSFMRGAALAPQHIREALYCDSANLCAENGIDLSAEPRFRVLGDLELTTGSAALTRITETVADLLARGVKVLTLGGDHAITYPILRAYGTKYEKLNILQFDAHSDTYDEFASNRHSHACPFARIMEEKLAARLVQVGIRTLVPHQRAQIARFGIEVIEMRDWHSEMKLEFVGPVYISLDMDVLDPAFAPGVSHHEPGGLSTREVLRLIQSLRAPIVGADIVEVNPTRDAMGITAMVAAKFLKEIAAIMLTRIVP